MGSSVFELPCIVLQVWYSMISMLWLGWALQNQTQRLGMVVNQRPYLSPPQAAHQDDLTSFIRLIG